DRRLRRGSASLDVSQVWNGNDHWTAHLGWAGGHSWIPGADGRWNGDRAESCDLDARARLGGGERRSPPGHRGRADPGRRHCWARPAAGEGDRGGDGGAEKASDGAPQAPSLSGKGSQTAGSESVVERRYRLT